MVKGLKVGLEFHQRLDTAHKLFCNCRPAMGENITSEIERKLRPVAGELGEIDPAVLQEFLRAKTFDYQVFSKETCLVELDESPPEGLNQEALDIALQIALMLDCDIVDEIHVMRKTVLDGSAISGFQRTALIGHDGKLKTAFGDVEISGVFLEEEAAGIVGKKEHAVYRLDRLGIPLIEIATRIMELEPAQIKEVALKLGALLRVTGKVQRGLGTIRQDVNISIPGGDRTEIKGLQDVRMLDVAIELEVQRQQKLIELSKRAPKAELRTVNLTKYFSESTCKLLAGKTVHGLVIPDFASLLGFELTAGRRFGSELADHAKVHGFGGIITSDEDLKKYGIEREAAAIRRDFKLRNSDAFILLAGENADAALNSMTERIKFAAKGVPRETRVVLPDGSTAYMRPLPGAARMYPETDLPSTIVSKEKIAELKKSLPAEPEKVFENLLKKYNLSDELASRMVTSKYAPLFYEICEMQINPTLAATTFLNTLAVLRREGTNVTVFTASHFKDLFKAVGENKISKAAIPNVLRHWSTLPKQKIENIIMGKEFRPISDSEIANDIKKLISGKEIKKKEMAFKILMAELMKKYRGKIEGGKIATMLKKELG